MGQSLCDCPGTTRADDKMKYTELYLVWALLLSSIGGLAHAGNASSKEPELVEQGRAIYTNQCSRCHGYNMVNNGLVGFDLRKFPKDQHERFVNSVRQGKPPKMPPWGDVLSDNDIEALWAYVKIGGTS